MVVYTRSSFENCSFLRFSGRSKAKNSNCLIWTGCLKPCPAVVILKRLNRLRVFLLPVRIRIILFSTGDTKILPSPISPVRAAEITFSTTWSNPGRLLPTIFNLELLQKFHGVFRAPVTAQVWPFWRPNPRTSEQSYPPMPALTRAILTSSNLKGRMNGFQFFFIRKPSFLTCLSATAIRLATARIQTRRLPF